MEQKNTPNNALRKERELRGWSQGYVAEQIEAPSPSYISRWERGVIIPTPYYREKLCRLFDKNAQELGLVQVQGEVTFEVPPANPEPIPSTHPPLPRPIRHRWVLLGALLLVVSALLAVALAVWSPTSSTRSWPRLQYNPYVQRQAVKIMQYMLKAHGYDIGTFGPERDGVDGLYGHRTEAAIRDFKDMHHLAENNDVDDPTWEQLIKPSEAGRIGIEVKALQVQLNDQIKSTLPRNGQFDSATENAVRRFQQVSQLPVTGRADLDVWCLLVGGHLSNQ